MKKGLILIITMFLVTSLFAEKLKITKDEALNVKISNSQPTVVQFNFFIKKIKKIFLKKNIAQVTLLDKGIVIIPTQKDSSGIIILTNEQGTSYTLNFKTDANGTAGINVDDLTYSKEKPSKLKLETQFVDRDVSNIITRLDNMNPKKMRLPGFKLEKDSYSVNSSDGTYKMTKMYRWIGSKYIVDSWVITNKTKAPLVFENRDFAKKGIIAASVQPKVIYPNGVSSLYLIIDKATVNSLKGN